MRLFTALEIPADVARELALWRGGLPGARWIEPGDYHLTLRFIGDIDEASARDLDEALSTVQRPPFEVRLEGLDQFGNNKPRAIIAKAAPTPALMELQAEHERLVRRAGLPPETRRFTPHVTLARLRRVTPAAVAEALQERPWRAARTLRVDRFVLMSSRALVGGGPYRVEATYRLG